MAEKKNNVHSRPNDAFLRKYGYVIRPSRSHPGMSAVYDRNGNPVSQAAYKRSVDAWNRSQQITRLENKRRATQKEPYQEQTDRYQTAKQTRRNQARLTQNEARRLQAQTERTLSGGAFSPSSIVGAAVRKYNHPERDFTSLMFTGYDSYGPNSGITTAKFAGEHPNASVLANLGFDTAIGAAAGIRRTGAQPGYEYAVDAYDFAGPTGRIAAGAEPAGLLGTRNLPSVRPGTEMVPIENPLQLGTRNLPAAYNGSALGPALRPRTTAQLSFSPNMTVRGSSEVVPYYRNPVASASGPIDLQYTGTDYITAPGSPGYFWYDIPMYFNQNYPRQYAQDVVPVQQIPDEIPSSPSGGNGSSGNGKGRSNKRNRGNQQYTPSLQEQIIPHNLGPAVFDAMLMENRTPDYLPQSQAADYGRTWAPVVDMDGNTIIHRERGYMNAEDPYAYAKRPEDVIPNTEMERIKNQDFDPRNYGFGGVFYI